MRLQLQLRRSILGPALLLSLLRADTGAFAQDIAKPAEKPITPQTESPAPTHVQISEKEMKKLFVKRVKPEYPPLAEQARIVGKCRVRIVVGADGNVRSIQLVYGHPMLAPAAIRAAKESKYRPYLVNGQPVEAEGEVEYHIPY